MKRSNLFLGASAFILAIAGAFATKAAKAGHHQVVFTKGSAGTGCVAHSDTQGLTKTTISNATFKTGCM